MTADDLFTFNTINLDPLTETYSIAFYLSYMAQFPEYCVKAVSPPGMENDTLKSSHQSQYESDKTSIAGGPTSGYILGKVEGNGKLWHGHVTALTVSPDSRRMGLAGKLMNLLEEVSEKFHNAYFVDLFVRKSNAIAIGMYEKLGYSIYRRVIEYYSGPDAEDAYDMRKALPRDVNKESVVPLKHPIYPEDLEW